ncbi:hypothetical protein AAG570_008801 [Ranatra chinensis]|uniref:Armadillo repeat-containing protein 4 n=1 Tax=Ranatra chinensis TaxID=642074 RepID=A0ABD0YU44_9HEMI
MMDTRKNSAGNPSSTQDVSQDKEAPWFLKGLSPVYVEDYDLSEQDMSSQSEKEVTDIEEPWTLRNEPRESYQVGDFWKIIKLVKYFKAGNESTAAFTLAMLADYDYSRKTCWMALVQSGCVQMLINLLDVDDLRCQLGSLTILEKMSVAPEMQVILTDMGLVQDLIRLQLNSARDVKAFAVSILSNMANMKKVRTIVRKNSGIAMLMDHIDRCLLSYAKPLSAMIGEEVDVFRLAKKAVITLEAMSRSPAIRREMYNGAIFKLFPALLDAVDPEISLCAFKMLMYSASLPEFKESIEAHGLMSTIMKNLTSGDPVREELAVRTIYKLTENELSRTQVRTFKALQVLVGFMNDDTKPFKVLKYASGTVLRCTKDKETVAILNKMNIIGNLLRLITHEKPIHILTYLGGMYFQISINSAAILVCLSSILSNRGVIRRFNGLPLLMDIVTNGHCYEVVASAVKIIGNCAYDPACMEDLQDMDTLRLVWSLLNSKSPSVIANAAWALVPIIKRYKLPSFREVDDPGRIDPRDKAVGTAAFLPKEIAREHVSALGRAEAEDGVKVPKHVPREREAGDDRNRYMQFAILLNSGEIIRNYAGAIDMLMALLDHPDLRVKSGACSAVAYLSYDDINMEIITELGILKKLDEIIKIDSDLVRENVCVAIATVGRSPTNNFELGRMGFIEPVIGFLDSDNQDVVTAAAFALWKLSADPINTITIYKSGIVPILMDCMTSESLPLQQAAAGCLNNMRGIAHEADQLRHMGEILIMPRMKKSFRSKSVIEAVLEAEKQAELNFQASQNKTED